MGSLATITKETVVSAIEAADLQFSDRAVISFPGEASFKNATLRWNPYKKPSFSASVTASNEKDVAATVKLARALKVSFLATSTRHGYGMTLGHQQGGLAIDLSRLDGIHLDGDILTVGPGATVNKVMDVADKAGYEIPVPSHATISLVSVSMGGGVNRWSGVYGLVLDSLISAVVVTHDGEIVEASESQNPDLFWALRGAGANFGIVVSAKYTLPKSINNGEILSADVVIPIDQTYNLFKVLETLTKNQPAELAIIFYVVWSGDLDKPVIVANFVWHGTKDEGFAVMKPLLSLNSLSSNVRTIRWKEVIGTDAGVVEGGIGRIIYGFNIRETDVATFVSSVEKLVWFYDEFPAGRGSAFVVEFFANDAMLRIPDETTAYPWRDATCNLMVQMSWTEPDPLTEAAAKALGEQIRQEQAKTSGYGGLSVYVNYAVGNEALEEVYGERKLAHLLELKAKWDPDNVFRYHHPLVRE